MNPPLLIIGLGNPGSKYEHTRHNAGFLALDQIAQKLDSNDFALQKKFHAEVTEGRLTDGTKVILAKPTTFMNGSGQSARALVDFYKSDITRELVIIHDDLDIPLGQWKDVQDRGAAGQNGVIDIIEKLGTKDFRRIRIGIDGRTEQQRQHMSGADYVLGRFAESETEKLKEVLRDITDIVIK